MRKISQDLLKSIAHLKNKQLYYQCSVNMRSNILAKIEAANHKGRFTYIEVCKILIFSQYLLVNELRKKYLFELNILLVLAVLLFA